MSTDLTMKNLMIQRNSDTGIENRILSLSFYTEDTVGSSCLCISLSIWKKVELIRLFE